MASCMTESFKVHSCAHKRIHDKNDFEVEPTEKQRITMLSDKPVRKSNKENSMCNVTIKTKESHSENHKKHEKKAPKQEKAKHEFLDKLYEMMIKDGFMKARDRNEKVVEFSYPEELKQKIDFDLGSKTSDEKILSLCQDIIKYSVKVAHPRFFNQLYGGLDEYSLGGCWLTETMNASLYTYEVSPVFSLMERVVIDKMLGKIGFEDGDAMFCPGGSISNMYALNIARYFKYPEVKKKGIKGIPDICAFTSEKCHYSIGKGVAFMGMGLDNLINVKTDANGKMIPEDLEKKILEAKAEGKTPYFVNATAGTTVFGAFDPIDEIADICQKYNLWMHVDGAWGGGALLSKTYSPLLKGVERADSMTWNPHKLMGVPQQCSLVFTKHKGLLEQCHSANASYLFQQDKFYDVSYDTGDKSIQCGRKNDVLKLWIMWKNKGDEGFERDIDNQFECAKYLAQLVQEREGFELMLEPQCTNVCFYYIPKRLRGLERTPEWWNEISKVGPKVKEGMMKAGSMMVGYQPDGDFVNFFRMIISNLDTVKSDMDFVVDEIDRLGKDL
uniref:Cysteine sulfinic acid decarboxylase n=1 Tax=Magallana gigas TaxID=29159 RepID=K1QRN2_MAGGI|eukprot:XP_011418227.1 PREDICTED: cysteine sulfinic acid decarboxylase [Crassostrea gigas]